MEMLFLFKNVRLRLELFLHDTFLYFSASTARMDPGLVRVYTRLRFIDTSSQEIEVHARTVLDQLDEASRVYQVHLGSLHQRLQTTKQQLDELKILINRTVSALKMTAGIAALDTMTQRVDRLNYEGLVLRRELRKELSE